MSEKETNPPVSFPIKPPGPPKVWRVIEVVRKGEEKPIKFSIEEVPEDRYDDVVDHMVENFIVDEPICNCLDGKNDPQYVQDFRQFWQHFMHHGLSVGAFVENPDGGKPIIAGVNVLALSYKDEKHDTDHYTSEKMKKVTDVILSLANKAQVYEKYGVDRYMSAYGLSVDPKYRGASLGGHLLKAREDIGREYNIAVSATAFTSPISQKLAARCGFETLIEQNYDEALDKEGNLIFPGIKAKVLKIMARRLY